MISAILVPVVSVVMMTVGWRTTETAIQEIQDWVGDVETLTYRGWNAFNGLEQSRHSLLNGNNPVVNGILEYYQYNQHLGPHNHHDEQFDADSLAYDLIDHRKNNSMTTTPNPGFSLTSDNSSTNNDSNVIFVDQWCPEASAHKEQLQFLIDAMETVQDNTQTMAQVFDQFLAPNSTTTTNPLDDSYFRIITDTTSYIDETLQSFLRNDWWLKLVIMVLNVVNFLLLMNVYCLSKHNIIHPPTRMYVAYVLVPLFVVLVLAVWIITCVLGISAIVNADFCAGGPAPGSPQGTVEDALLSVANYGLLDRTIFNTTESSSTAITHPLSVVYSAIEYYSSGCLKSENPLDFLDDISSKINVAVAHVNQLSSFLPEHDNADALATLNEACGTDMSFLAPAFLDLSNQLTGVQSHMEQLIDTASCNQLSPLLRRISHGALCVESPFGLTVMWCCSLVLCILCFIMLSTRAALYNAVKPKKPRDKKPRRVVEKEFAEYKEYMAQYYEDAGLWKIDHPVPSETQKATKISLEFDQDLESKRTFDTASSSSNPSDEGYGHFQREESSGPKNGEASEICGIHQNHQEDDSYGSSYDSEVSDDSDADDGNDSIDDEQSAIVSFISETKSIAMQTVHSLQRLTPMLLGNFKLGSVLKPTGKVNDDNEDDEADLDNAFLFEDGPRSATIQNSMREESMYTTTSMIHYPTTLGLEPSSGGLAAKKKSPARDRRNFHHYMGASTDTPSTPSSRGRNTRSSAIRAGLWKEVYGNSARVRKNDHYFDGPRLLEALTPSSAISALTPLAPSKVFSFLSRSKSDKYDGDGPNTPSSSSRNPLFSFSPAELSVEPKQLELSPLLTPSRDSKQKVASSPPGRKISFDESRTPVAAVTANSFTRRTESSRPINREILAARTGTVFGHSVRHVPKQPRKPASSYRRTNFISSDDDDYDLKIRDSRKSKR
jgi:hypothetical protein